MSVVKKTTANGRAGEVGPVSNDAEADIQIGHPYTVRISICGTADILFHRWSCEAVESKGKAKKGSAEKKTDNVESYVARNETGHICLPGEYLRGAIVGAAKFRQDPRSSRKSAQDLFKAGIISMTPLAPILIDGKPTKDWGYLHKCRVTVMRAGITRTRPAFHAGWEATQEMMVAVPGHIDVALLQEVVEDAGRLVGVADFRPTYGRFRVTSFQKL